MEGAVVKIAFNDVAVDITLGQRPGAVSALVVGDVNSPVHIEDGESEIAGLDFDGAADGYVGYATER